MTQSDLSHEINRRRTFAIISHPDAGKTTITEKLLLYGGAIHEAGSVTAREGSSHTKSDWMSMEQQRGISITSSALSFEFDGHHVNLLDTPGHQDFSEDTYRTLTAADSALMVLDAARGVQAQTEKLFAVCRNRGIPILTFVNKMDRPAQDPFELLEQVEKSLAIRAVPLTWPIGDGPDFRGVYDLEGKRVLLFERVVRGRTRAPVSVASVDDPALTELVGAEQHAKLRQDVELIEGAIEPFDPEAFLAGEVTPVFFGSAITNFGVEHFLSRFVKLAPCPAPLHTTKGELSPEAPFTGFVFKLQANMSKHHRDRTAFLRIASGRFERGMEVVHTRTGRELRLSRAHTLFAQDRESIDVAYPGDIVGLVNPGVFRIGDVVSVSKDVHLEGFPRFTPEHFNAVTPRDVSKRKAFRKGLEQLAEEGVVQIFYPTDGARDPIIGAVGQLQFEVFEHRMNEEYGVDLIMSSTNYKVVRWLAGEPDNLARFAKHVEDDAGRPVMLFTSSWDLDYTAKQHPELEFLPQPRDLTVVTR
ncbi:peptide chain release factor 3 [Deinococcus peraridilitoris]|uniref:Peptide chain release factor 3 n=1 Tax=Deinococcus peraridilitoris (strain DSM 19664 / LMG 22246 / CIP 109416 / KR-200) TaxID=937777 RepID=K9ZZR2_DEIPD|nr:peptide chain release factor 3 [Deinococcus peraridilitoris]AFZ66432.1 peptide chain release factor 3 [Deinococcus peraridilitoris DSM 19664]